jgi:hypothetical protein
MQIIGKGTLETLAGSFAIGEFDDHAISAKSLSMTSY